MSGRLFEPIQIGSMKLKNRIVMPPMCTNFASETGAVTERIVEYYAERAKGGAGFIIVEATCIDSPQGKISSCQLCVDNDKFIPGLSDLTEAVHAYGAKIALQLHHAGRQTLIELTNGKTPVSASDVPYVDSYGIPPGSILAQPRPLTLEEINILEEKFGAAAGRAKLAGFDAVEIHGAHGYLIAQFLSPFTNKRTDAYGGDFNGRMRFALEVIQRVREKVSGDFPISFRFSADEYIEGGINLELAEKIAERLEGAGVDILNVSGSIGETDHLCEAPMAVSPGYMVHLAEAIKKTVNIPVITVGRINNPTFAEKILKDGKADLVAMGRALIADPELPRKTFENKLEDVRRCIACNQGCIYRLMLGLRVKCTVNAEVGKERDFKLTLAKPKKILIAGGGPAGMEAARVSALRGHKVVVFEKADRLGGQLNLAVKPPYKGELENILQYLKGQLRRLNVKIELGSEVTLEIVEEINPDVVIIATGATPISTGIQGSDEVNVITAWDVLEENKEVGGKVVIAGGKQIGCETAEFLAERGKDVTIVVGFREPAADMEPYNRYLLLRRLSKNGVNFIYNSRVKEIKADTVIVLDNNFNMKTLKVNTVILALGVLPNNKLLTALQGRVKELYAVGDCVKPAKILEAINDASRIARII